MVLAEYKNIIPEPEQTDDLMKKNQFVQTKKGFINGFTEVRTFMKYRYLIRHTVSDKWTITNHEDLGIFIKNYLRLS